jgi:hypothetical protein
MFQSMLQSQSQHHEQSIKMNTNHLPYVITFNHHYRCYVFKFFVHYKRMWFFSHKKLSLIMTHVLDKLFGFIHYNVQYVTFSVAYITLKLKLKLNIKLWHIETT